MTVTADGWTIFRGGHLAKCVAPAANPGDLRRVCNKWFSEIGPSNCYLVRVHPKARQISKPGPTRNDSNVHQCEKCGTHLEYRVVPASAVAPAGSAEVTV